MSQTLHDTLVAIHDVHQRLTGRESRYAIYERSLWDFHTAGFTAADLECVLNFMLRENRQNDFKYSLQLGKLIQDHERFSDLLGEAKAKNRNSKKAPTPKEIVVQQLRPNASDEAPTNGHGRHISEIFRAL